MDSVTKVSGYYKREAISGKFLENSSISSTPNCFSIPSLSVNVNLY